MLPKYIVVGAVLALAAPPVLRAQTKPAVDCAKVNDTTINHGTMDHAAHLKSMEACAGAVPTLPGQAAFGAISEVVRMLKADPKTDWSKVDVEALRQHLIDMDDVVMHAAVSQRAVPGGVEMDVSGTGRTIAAIKRMAINHTKMLDQGGEYRAAAVETPAGAKITVTAKAPANARLVAQIRGLGFAGIMTEGDHHAAHHIAIARGEAPHSR
jgi:hypothetical protein